MHKKTGDGNKECVREKSNSKDAGLAPVMEPHGRMEEGGGGRGKQTS